MAESLGLAAQTREPRVGRARWLDAGRGLPSGYRLVVRLELVSKLAARFPEGRDLLPNLAVTAQRL